MVTASPSSTCVTELRTASTDTTRTPSCAQQLNVPPWRKLHRSFNRCSRPTAPIIWRSCSVTRQGMLLNRLVESRKLP
ncbi:unnamed protein product [Leptidea sinapis]|uniref:Uncharacterized protein n=1 Tax=Leptidea sinapis TaxID=189913 RepID=A0A5E4QR38_9NEOP|nr:unnamed protein product [Leptidea sinapis]